MQPTTARSVHFCSTRSPLSIRHFLDLFLSSSLLPSRTSNQSVPKQGENCTLTGGLSAEEDVDSGTEITSCTGVMRLCRYAGDNSLPALNANGTNSTNATALSSTNGTNTASSIAEAYTAARLADFYRGSLSGQCVTTSAVPTLKVTVGEGSGAGTICT